jgi:glycosyltransferase involved in cell wall biosynthesis
MPPGGWRILILSNFFTEGHGGTPESVLLLARQLAALNIACDVLCNMGLCQGSGARDRLPRSDENAAFRSAGGLVLSDYAGLLVAGSWNLRAPLLVLRARLSGLPVVYTAKGCLSRIEFTRLRDIRRVLYLLLVEIWLVLAARCMVFTSSAEERACVVPRKLWHWKKTLIPEPFEGSALAPPAAGTGKTIGFMAEISPRKGLLELIAAFGMLLAANPAGDVRLRIAGHARAGSKKYLECCKELARANGSASNIKWCAPVRGAARYDFYAGLDLFVCPSRFESFGLTVLEALWQGVPVCVGPELGVLEFLNSDAPVLKLSSLQAQDIAAALGAFVEGAWPPPGTRSWAGRPALTRSNRDIAQTFATLFARSA